MKSLAQYLVETRQTFDYRIKILGDADAELINKLEEKLQQFDVVKMTEPKKTPIQKILSDFPGAENESTTFMDVTFNYPATPPQITQIAELCGMNPNHICIEAKDYADSVDEERKGYEEQPNPVLGSDEGEQPENAESKKASEYFAADPYKREIVGNEYKSDFTIAGGKTPPAKFTTDFPNSVESPIMGTNKIPVIKASNGSSAPENRKDGPPGKNTKGKRNY
tara:strand:- start:18 stop:686 length:669 start_codon:yes stop_codon:yes gene_type:complete